MPSPTLQQAVDFANGTLQHIMSKKPAMTYLYENYSALNDFFGSPIKVQGGDYIEDNVNLGDEGNAVHAGRWDEDSHNIVNIEKKYRTDWVLAKTNFSYNLIEQSLNAGAMEKIFDIVQNKFDNMCREWADEIVQKLVSTPSSSSDDLTPIGLSGWLPLGTNGSTGGWTGYVGHYGDGTAFNVGGLNSSSTVNTRWASYYADHDGNIDDSLLLILFKAMQKLNFQGPKVPKVMDLNTEGYSPRFDMYTSLNVQAQLAQLYAKADDQMGFRPQVHYGVPHFMNIPLNYWPILDTADTIRYGTDPIFGVNHQLIYPVVQSDWQWKITPPINRASGGQHLVMTVYGDLLYAVHGRNRRHAGFLISQQ
jgi:hypothetical protein